MSRSVTVLVTVLVTLALLALGGLAVILTGAYDVSATQDHSALTQWALGTLTERSVARRAASVTGAPPTDPEAVEHGLEHFDAMCAGCHGAPGLDRDEVGRGMNPTPPDLADELDEWSDAELFRITKHGIRLAGMPAFGLTHDDDEVWAIVAFLREMEGMSPDAYAERVEALGAGGEEGEEGHTHAPGTPEHHH
ncbi:MAG: cytochrome c [Gemmatimonadota bacterium]|jgi:mono/diheme cytochrome c family protein